MRINFNSILRNFHTQVFSLLPHKLEFFTLTFNPAFFNNAKHLLITKMISKRRRHYGKTELRRQAPSGTRQAHQPPRRTHVLRNE